MDIVILCSGITKGMKSFGPKALVPVGPAKQPLLVHQILSIRKQSAKYPIYVIVGFDKDRIISILKKYNIFECVKIIEHNEFDKQNTGGSIFPVLDKLHSNTLFIDDGIVTKQLQSFNKSFVPILNQNKEKFDIGCTFSNNSAEYLFYDLQNKWAEFVGISKNDIENFKTILTNNQKKITNMFLFEIINLLIDNNIILQTTKISSNKILKIINHKDTEE